MRLLFSVLLELHRKSIRRLFFHDFVLQVLLWLVLLDLALPFVKDIIDSLFEDQTRLRVHFYRFKVFLLHSCVHNLCGILLLL